MPNKIPNLHESLQRQGVVLPPPAAPVASYIPVLALPEQGLAFVSGQLPFQNGKLIATGSVPDQVSVETAQVCARACVINALAALEDELGLEKILQVVKVEGFVCCGRDFHDHSRVINGASDFLGDIMGDAGRHTRAAVGVASLPLNSPVEVAFLFAIARAQ